MTAAEVARALAAHPRWVWAPAMLPVGCYRVGGDGFEAGVDGPADAVPDLTDAATAGVLLEMLGDALWTVSRRSEPKGYTVVYHEPDGPRAAATGWQSTLGEAAGRALLAVSATGWQSTLGEAAGRALLAVWGPS